MGGDDLINDGVIIRAGRNDAARANPDKTFIVTGVPRGGTTLMAGLLHEAGVYLGEDVLDLTHEDREFIAALYTRNHPAMGALIARRNARGGPWGFKAPILSHFMKPEDLQRFRNLHLIVVFRDPIAIGVRQAMAEHESPLATARNAANAMAELVTLVEKTSYPTLMLSYEKCITSPEPVIDTFMNFCGFGADPGLRQRLLNQVRPNDHDYAVNARRVLNGMIDGLVGTHLAGWCWDQRSGETFSVDICLDGRKAATVRSEEFRQDLEDAGIGHGRYGFFADLAPLGAGPDTIITVNITGKTYPLPNGGKPLRVYAGFNLAHFAAMPAS